MDDSHDGRPGDATDDADLAVRMERAQHALEQMGLTGQDLLDELPAARAAVLHDAYDDTYRQEIDKLIAAFEATHGPLSLSRDPRSG